MTFFVDQNRPPGDHEEVSSTALTSEYDATAENNHEQYLNKIKDGRLLQRFYVRAIIGTIAPFIVVFYLVFIWRTYLAPFDRDSPIAFGPPGAKWIFYCWFVAGVIGLNLSLYGLAGAEAGMLMEPMWKVTDAMRLMLHADQTWSGPGGWFKAIRWTAQMRKNKNEQSRFPGRLWAALALPSMLVFVAWPLSGLWLEMTSGFRHGISRSGANVLGFIYSDFNANPGGRRPTRDSLLGVRAPVPGFGAVYTAQGADRSKAKYLQAVPVMLPDDEGVEEIFLTAQGETPIEGKVWGLLLHYDCQVVKKKSDLRLLKNRQSATDLWGSKNASPAPGSVVEKRQLPDESTDDTKSIPFLGATSTLVSVFPGSTTSPGFPAPTSDNNTEEEGEEWEQEDTIPVHFDDSFAIKYKSYRLNDDSVFVEARKETRGGWNGGVNSAGDNRSRNVDAVIEIAYEAWPIPIRNTSGHPCKMPQDTTQNPATAFCYYDVDEDTMDHYPGFEKKRVFEALLWQGLRIQGGWGSSNFSTNLFNTTIDHNITGMYGEYIMNDTPFNTGMAENLEDEGEALTAVGVSCTSSSSVGTAEIDGVWSTYSNFERTDSPIPARKGDCARRLGAETPACTLDLDNDGWLYWLFDSVGAPPPLDQSDPNNLIGSGDWRENAQLIYLQAEQLRQSMLQAYSNYAIRLMYNDGRDFIGADGSRLRKFNRNVTAFVAATVITPGVIPASVPVVLFGLWALISSALCLVYGFRRRWSATLDGHTVFRLGVELRENYRAKIQQDPTVAEIEECPALHEVPGFVGDMDHDRSVGRIGLVDGQLSKAAAQRRKFYH